VEKKSEGRVANNGEEQWHVKTCEPQTSIDHYFAWNLPTFMGKPIYITSRVNNRRESIKLHYGVSKMRA